MQIMYNQEEFLSALSQSYKNYLTFGARSMEKLKPVHIFSSYS